VETFGLRALPPDVPLNGIVDAALRKRVIEGVNANLNEFYIDAALAKQMGDVLSTHETPAITTRRMTHLPGN
jgi:hypothetical protein